jgi:hypothetical protein
MSISENDPKSSIIKASKFGLQAEKLLSEAKRLRLEAEELETKAGKSITNQTSIQFVADSPQVC